MNTYDVTIGANGVFELHGRGRFLRLMTSSGPVGIEYYSAGRVIAQADGVEAGYAEEFDGQGFDRVRVTANPGVTIKAVIRESGRVAYDRGASTADVLSLPPVDVQSMPVVEVERDAVGASVYTSAAVASATVIDPVANVNGAVVRTATMLIGGGGVIALVSDTAAPASYTDATARGILSVFQTSDSLQREIYIPPGYGVYIRASAAGYASVSYDLL